MAPGREPLGVRPSGCAHQTDQGRRPPGSGKGWSNAHVGWDRRCCHHGEPGIVASRVGQLVT